MRRKPVFVATAFVVLAGLAVTAEVAPSGADTVGEVTTWRDPTGDSDFPHDLVVGDDGLLWFTATQWPSLVGRISSFDPVTETFTSYADDDFDGPELLAPADDGGLWFTATEFPGGLRHRAPNGTVTVHADAPTAGAQTLLAGPDGDLWIKDYLNGQIRRYDPDTEEVTTYEDESMAYPFEGGMAFDAAGDLWFTGFGTDTVGVLDPDTGDVMAYDDVDGEVDKPYYVTEGPDGAIWFSSYENDRIGRLDPDLDDITTYAHPEGLAIRPESIVTGPDGNLWFGTSGGYGIGRIMPDGFLRMYDDDFTGWARSLVVGPDGAVWFAAPPTNIGRVAVVDTPADITIELDAAPADGRDFSFTATGAGVDDFVLDADTDPTRSSSVTFSDLEAGEYVITQNRPGGWSMTGLSCDGSPAAQVTESARRVIIGLNGDDVTCRFTNRRHRPDLHVAAPTGPFVGNNVYATTPAPAQTRVARAPARATRSFQLRLQNDGSLDDRFRLRGVASGAGGFTVKYFAGGLDVTSRVANGTFQLVSPLPPGTSFSTPLTVRITPGPTSRRGTTRTVVLTMRPVGSSTPTDVARVRLTRS